jgi:hypothetical protein
MMCRRTITGIQKTVELEDVHGGQHGGQRWKRYRFAQSHGPIVPCLQKSTQGGW